MFSFLVYHLFIEYFAHNISGGSSADRIA